MDDWNKYYKEAADYSKAAFGAFNKRRLGNHVIYNLIGLAVENYLTALCMKLDTLPVHSSIGSMLAQLKKQCEVPETFFAEARFINKFMNFCSLDIMDTPEPNSSALARMLSFMNDVKNFSIEILDIQPELV